MVSLLGKCNSLLHLWIIKYRISSHVYSLHYITAWLRFEFGPQEINLGGKTSPGGDGDGGDCDLSDGGGDGTVESARAGGGGGGDEVGRGEYGAEGGGDGRVGGNLIQDASEFGGIAEAEAVEAVDEHCGALA